MEAVRDVWTDERLDDLNHRVDSGFEEVNREFQALRLEMRTEFAAVRGEMAAMNRALIQVGAGFMVTMFVGFAATIATVLSQT
jgi:tetrahydrodipicolinate N-succinyltransferase